MQTRSMADRRPSGVSPRSARPLRSLPKTKSGAGSRSSQKSGPAQIQEDPAVTEPEADVPNPRAPKQRKVETPRKPRGIVTTQETAVKELQESLLQKETSLKRDWRMFEKEVKLMNIQLDGREKALQKKKRSLGRLLCELADETEAVRDREQAARKRELDLKTRETEIVAKTVQTEEKLLLELEAKWQCALCYDVMAHPYSLSPASCGHIYCSLCILKWFFTNLCDHCGGWCTILECPLCRTALAKIPNAIPRPMYSLPFTPARAADERITEMIDFLRGPVPAGPSKPSGIKGRKGKGKKKQSTSAAGPSTGWEHGGTLLLEWQGRDSQGRTEMRSLVARWPQLTATGLRALKTRLGAPP